MLPLQTPAIPIVTSYPLQPLSSIYIAPLALQAPTAASPAEVTAPIISPRARLIPGKATVSHDFPKEARAAIKAMVKKVNASLGALQIPAITFERTVYESYMSAEYHPGPNVRQGLIFGNERIETEIRGGRAAQPSLIMSAHEYGHAVFDHNAAVNSSLGRLSINDLDKARKNGLEKKSRELGLEDLETRWQAAAGDRNQQDAAAELAMRINKIYRKDIEPLNREIDKDQKLRTFLRPYNELFGDIIAVIYAEDPKAVANALGLSKRPYVPREIGRKTTATQYWKHRLNAPRPRDFSQNIKMGRWAPDPETYDYTLLDPARSYIGSHYLGDVSDSMTMGIVLQAFISAAVRQAQKRLHRKGAEQVKQAAGINKGFISAFEKEMSALRR